MSEESKPQASSSHWRRLVQVITASRKRLVVFVIAGTTLIGGTTTLLENIAKLSAWLQQPPAVLSFTVDKEDTRSGAFIVKSANPDITVQHLRLEYASMRDKTEYGIVGHNLNGEIKVGIAPDMLSELGIEQLGITGESKFIQCSGSVPILIEADYLANKDGKRYTNLGLYDVEVQFRYRQSEMYLPTIFQILSVEYVRPANKRDNHESLLKLVKKKVTCLAYPDR